MKAAPISRIREEVLRDPRYPVHQIADQLLPYLRVLVEQFQPEQVILFGSYVRGHPTADSDIDLLVVKPLRRSPVRDATDIRRAFRPLRRAVANLPMDIMVRDPESLAASVRRGAAFHSDIVRDGLVLV